MKKLAVTLLVLAVITVFSAGARIWNPKGMSYPDKVVFNPEFMAQTSGALKIDRIELFRDSTRVVFTANCPHWGAIMVDRNLTLDVDGAVLIPINVYGLTFGELFHLQKWGKRQFIMVYPAINRKVKSLSVVHLGGIWNIYGVRLDGEKYNRPTIDDWLETKSVYYTGSPKQFIYPEPKTVVYEGFINGYDPKVFKRTFRINNINEITGVEQPINVPINDDGSFRIELKTYFPKFILADYPLDMTVKSYIEPERNLAIYFDRNMILGQRAGNINVWNSAIESAGDLGLINNQLYASWAVWTPEIKSPLYNVKSLRESKKIIDRLDKEQVAKLKTYAYDFMIFPYSEEVILANEKAGMIETLLLQEKNLSKVGSQESIPDGYYDFIKNDMGDNLILTSAYFPSIARLLSESRYREVLGLANVYAYTDIVPSGRRMAIVKTIQDEAEAMCRYLEVKRTPLWWQIMIAMRLASFGMMDADSVDADEAEWVISQLNESRALTEPAVIHALKAHYNIK